MKILFYTNHFLRSEEMMGGVNIYLKSIVGSLADARHEIVVIEKDPLGFNPIKVAGLQVIPLKKLNLYYRCGSVLKRIIYYLNRVFPKWDIKLDNAIEFLTNALSFSKQLSSFDELDIVQIPNLESIGLFLPQKRNYKLIVRASSDREFWDNANEITNTLDNRLINNLERKIFHKADKIFAPSKYLARVLSEKLGRSVQKISTPLHVNFDNWDMKFVSENRLDQIAYILYFGVVLKRKGVFDLAAAMKQVWHEGVNLKLLIIGPDYSVGGVSNLSRMKKIIGDNCFNENVIYKSKLEHSQLFPVIQISRFVVLPSLIDNCPNSLLETIEIGKPLIGTFDSGLDEFYPDDCKHLLVKKNDPASLASVIMTLNNCSEEDLNLIGSKLKNNIEKTNSIDTITMQLVDYYHN